MKLRTLLLLGRTSNLPTVWSNVLAGAVMGGGVSAPALALLVVSGSAFYEGGMFLNDAFDASIDARERPARPIPSGQVSRGTVFALGFGLLGAGLVLLTLAPALRLSHTGARPLWAGLLTCLSILAYNRWHKGHAWSPLVMGACRAGLYAMAALTATATLATRDLLWIGALWLYVVGLTHVARFETGSKLDRAWVGGFLFLPLAAAAPSVIERRSFLPAACFVLLLGWSVRSLSFAMRGGPGQIPRAVVSLIAGISLVDALFIALRGEPLQALAALGCFLLTLKWQRRIPGT